MIGTVIRTVMGAVFGAIFGFIVGWIVEIFPRFNAALLDGIHGLTGIGGVRTSALLAAIGFIVGIISGLIPRHKWWHH